MAMVHTSYPSQLIVPCLPLPSLTFCLSLPLTYLIYLHTRPFFTHPCELSTTTYFYFIFYILYFVSYILYLLFIIIHYHLLLLSFFFFIFFFFCSVVGPEESPSNQPTNPLTYIRGPQTKPNPFIIHPSITTYYPPNPPNPPIHPSIPITTLLSSPPPQPNQTRNRTKPSPAQRQTRPTADQTNRRPWSLNRNLSLNLNLIPRARDLTITITVTILYYCTVTVTVLSVPCSPHLTSLHLTLPYLTYLLISPALLARAFLFAAAYHCCTSSALPVIISIHSCAVPNCTTTCWWPPHPFLPTNLCHIAPWANKAQRTTKHARAQSLATERNS